MTHQLFPEANSFENAKVAEDYPYSFTLRTKMYYWVEFKKNKGYRVVNQTINPKNGLMNKPKMGTYSFLPIYIGSNPDNNYLEPIYVPHYLDEKVEQFVADYWNQVPEDDKKLIKYYFLRTVMTSPAYYAEEGYTVDNLNEKMGW